MPIERVDVLIVGGGPAGLSTALHLVHADESFRERVVVLERARHPREKLCAGAVSGHAMDILNELGCALDIPLVSVERAVFRYGDVQLSAGGDPALRVTRRSEFDDWLCRYAVARGIRVEQGQQVAEIDIDSDRVFVRTKDRRYVCRVLVGADGTTSLVRRRAGLAPRGGTARLLEVRTPEDPESVPEFRDSMATFDFSSLAGGLQGYYWDFPSIVEGEYKMNRGVFESRVSRSAVRTNLVETLREKMAKRSRDLNEVEVRGFGIHQFQWRNEISCANVLLVGDAAGADPLLGEGIPCALAYGKIAARSILSGFDTGDLSFRSYRCRVLSSRIGRMMMTRALIAFLLYRSWHPRVMTSLARFLSWLQRDKSTPPALGNA